MQLEPKLVDGALRSRLTFYPATHQLGVTTAFAWIDLLFNSLFMCRIVAGTQGLGNVQEDSQ
eukprot:6485026-Amphidinium_carterae.1